MGKEIKGCEGKRVGLLKQKNLNGFKLLEKKIS
jgi:hypothetical protein